MGQNMTAAMKSPAENGPAVAASGVKFCTNCGKSVPGGAHFCPECGKAQ
jgi:membrane protease subunit (stomatin/prohibitin family)